MGVVLIIGFFNLDFIITILIKLDLVSVIHCSPQTGGSDIPTLGPEPLKNLLKHLKEIGFDKGLVRDDSDLG
jgi:hypothetical protein